MSVGRKAGGPNVEALRKKSDFFQTVASMCVRAAVNRAGGVVKTQTPGKGSDSKKLMWSRLHFYMLVLWKADQL